MKIESTNKAPEGRVWIACIPGGIGCGSYAVDELGSVCMERALSIFRMDFKVKRKEELFGVMYLIDSDDSWSLDGQGVISNATVYEVLQFEQPNATAFPFVTMHSKEQSS